MEALLHKYMRCCVFVKHEGGLLEMSKTIVVISAYVDTTIKEYQRDVNFLLFRGLEDLDKYITQTPIRAETLFFTKDVIPMVNTSLEYLSSMLAKVFLHVDNVIYITERNSPELVSIKFLIKTKKYTNWDIIEGVLNREYITSIINGSGRTDISQSKRKAIYRIPRDTYIAAQNRKNRSLEDAYADDDASLEQMDDEAIPVYIPPERDKICEIYHIVGSGCDERTVTVWLLSQYLSLSGKIVIVERDSDYHKLTEYATKSGVEYRLIEIADLLAEPYQTLELARTCSEHLVIFGSVARTKYNYAFIFNLVYNYLMADIDFMVREDAFGEEPTTSKYTVAFPSNMIGALRACDGIDNNFISRANFVGVNFASLPEMQIADTQAMRDILSDVLNYPIERVSIMNVKSLKIRGSVDYDIRGVLL